jgi:hypothetical protein
MKRFFFRSIFASKMTGLEEAVREFIRLKYVEKKWFGPRDRPEIAKDHVT